MILPPISQLLQRTRALAALDLIMSPEWDFRYYSFNSKWSTGQQMASMRDGSGDEWWLVFDAAGWAALKGLAHESSAWSKGRSQLSVALQGTIPLELASFANEPAFRWGETSFAYFCTSPAGAWCRANDLVEFGRSWNAGDDELLQLLAGGPRDYVEFAEGYFEKRVPIDAVDAVFHLRPINADVCRSLNPETDFEQIAKELLEEIEYPAA